MGRFAGVLLLSCVATGAFAQPSLTPEEYNQYWNDRELPLKQKAQIIIMATKCGVLDDLTGQVALGSIEATASQIDGRYFGFADHGQRLQDMFRSAHTIAGRDATPEACRKMKADPAFTASLKMWASSLLR